jgi:ribosomal protein L11 methyltransferase
MPLKWLILQAPAARADTLSDLLLEAGAQSVAVEDANAGTPHERPVYGEPGAAVESFWPENELRVLLDEQDDEAHFVALAAQACGAAPGERFAYRVEPVPEDDWVRSSQAQFEAIEAGPGIWIVPSWREPVVADALNIRIDPGLAFGTGTHPTTRLCLGWLRARVTPGCSVIDYGCGSGILAIAAAKLGAAKVCGVDVDPDAIRVAGDNAQRNGVVALFRSADHAPQGRFDLLVANILANPLRVLAPALAALVRPGGQIALSGILEMQEAELSLVYQAYFDMRVFARQDGWICLEGLRR